MLDDAGLKTDIQVDGGVTTENVRMLIEAGANVFVAGSAVFKNDAAANTKAFLEIFKEYE
jgi:ribulose-phosphate 3-epimerase